MSAIREIPCPECRRPVPWSEDSPFRPFCSKRCQMADFGDWAMERHRIPEAEPDVFSEELEQAPVRPDQEPR